MPKLPLKPQLTFSPKTMAAVSKPFNMIVGKYRFRTAFPTDADPEVAGWMSDLRVVDGLNMTGAAMDSGQLRAWIAGYDNVRKNLVMIRTLDKDQPVGFIMLDIEPRHRTGSFHLMIGSRAHRRGEAGLMAIKFALRYLFDKREVAKVTLEPLSRNQGAVKLCQWLGFRLEGVRAAQRLDLKSGERLDQHMFGMTQDEYADWRWK